MSSLDDVARWAELLEHRRSPMRPVALVALQREARALGLPGGSPAAIRAQAVEAMASVVVVARAAVAGIPGYLLKRDL